MIDPTRIVVATTFENRAPYTSETEILYRTLAAYGGRLAGARKIACSVGPPDPFVAEVLDDMGVEVREVGVFDERCPHANKLAMLELADEGDFVLALDTDVAIAGDPTGWLAGGSVVAKPVDNDQVGLDNWPALFEARGTRTPTARYLADFTARETIPYFNSGVVGVPSKLCAPLLEEWGAGVRWLLDEGYEQLPVIFDRLRFFTDQFAFALALAKLELPVRGLPVELNFPTNHPVHASLHPEDRQPCIVHHHHRLRPDGQLLTCTHRGANEAIRRVNEEIVRDPDAEPGSADRAPAPDVAPGQAPFDNQRFWNERYATNIALGSGIGSRGELLVRKRDLLQGVIDGAQPASMLDVGCGDIEIVRQLRFDGAYTGVDIAEVVLERNAQLMPDWSFVHGDFTTLARTREDMAADMVVCMDVLIHQHDPDYYREFVAELVRATRAVGVVAAYEVEPGGEFASDITAFHGPITDLLREVGATGVAIVDEYRGTAVVRYGPAAG